MKTISNNGAESIYEGRLGLVYARVSSKKQETDGSGLDSQEDRCVADLKSIGVKHIRTFADTFTGGGDFMQRPAMRELLAYIDSRPKEKFVVVFDDLKRLARDTEFHIKLRAVFKSRDVLLRCPNFKFEETAEGRFVETVFAAQGQLEREQNKRQVIQKMKARLEAGYWTFNGKKGYTSRKDAVHGRLFWPNEESKILAEAMILFANRTLQRKIDVCRFLVSKGFWKGNQSPEKYIDYVTHMLSDPFYCGDIQYLAWDVKRRKGHHQAIISLETFERIQKILKKENILHRIRQNISPDFPIRGLVNCDDCGKHLTAAWSKKKFAYYICHTKGCAIYGKSIRKSDIENKFVELMQRNVLKTEIGTLVSVVFAKVWNEEVAYLKEMESTKVKELKELEILAMQLTILMLKATSTQIKSVYEKQLGDVANKIQALSTDSTEKKDMSVVYRTALEKAVGLLQSPYEIWCTLPVYEQHRLFYFIFEEKLFYNFETGYRTDKISNTKRLFEELVTENTCDVLETGIEPVS